jgi:methyltransferase
MILSVAVLGAVTLQRLSELVIARRNTRRLLARGAMEVGAGHYPLIVVMHAAWLAGLWLLAWTLPVRLPWLAIFLALQGLRVWTLLSLGERWTTRIIILPGAPLIARGPYRFVRHPNYLVVVGEIAVLPLTFGVAWYALAFSALNAAALAVRIRAENRALRGAG